MQTERNGKIRWLAGEYAGRTYVLPKGESYWIGSSGDCEIPLFGEKIALHHLGIACSGERCGFYVLCPEPNSVFLEDGTPFPAGKEQWIPSGTVLVLGDGRNRICPELKETEDGANVKWKTKNIVLTAGILCAIALVGAGIWKSGLLNRDDGNGTQLGDAVGSLFGGGSSSGSSSSQWPSVMEKYQEILEASYYNDWAYFRTEDLNSDGIPELLIAIPDGTISITTYNNHGGTADLGSWECEVPIWYYPGSGIYGLGSDGDEKTYYYLESTDVYSFGFSSYLNPVIGQEFLDEDSSIGIHRAWYGKFVDPDDYETDEEYQAAKLGEVESWYGKYVNSDDYETNEEYLEALWSEMENGVSEERFMEMLNDATGGVEKVELPPYTEWYKDTEENREAYLK